MGRRKDSPENIRDTILESARNLFSRFGFKKTAVDEIAREAEVAKGTIYNYFESKDEIVREVFRKEQENLLEHLRAKVQMESSPVEKLKRMFNEKVEAITNSPLLKQVFLEPRSELIVGLDKELERMDGAEVNIIIDILKEIFSTAENKINDIAQVVQKFLGALISKAFEEDKLELIKKDISLITELIFSGLKKDVDVKESA